MTRRRWLVVVAAGLLLAIVVTGVAMAFPPGGRHPLPEARATDFFARRVLWAQGSTVHDGRRTYDVSPYVVQEMKPTAYGLLLSVSRTRRFDAPTHWVMFDGRRSAPLPGDVDTVAVSQDGRYAGWVDFDGPWRPAGRVAKVVVADLKSGDRVFGTSDGMGGGLGDDLGDRYEELEPSILGFDRRRAYWVDGSGHGNRWRWDLTTHQTQRAERPMARDSALIGLPWDPQRGPVRGIIRGRPVLEQGVGQSGFLSPDGRFLVRDATAHLPISWVRDRRPIRLDAPGRFAWFGGWQDDTTFYAMVRRHYEDGYDPSRPDRTAGTLVSCRLPSGHCKRLRHLSATRSVVLPGTDSTL